MAFSPVSLPIQEILLTDFVTDLATINNANSLIFKDKIEDLFNNFEIDLTALSIGTDNPINYVRAQSFVMQDTGFTFQTGSPTQIIAKLEKNISNESVLTVDRIISNIEIDADVIVANDIQVATSLTMNGVATMTSTLQYNAALIESKETVLGSYSPTPGLSQAFLVKNGTSAEGRITLTSASKKNIFVKIVARTSPNTNYVYDGVSAFDPAITDIILYIDFDAANPPAQNTAFNIYIVDIVEEFGNTSILGVVNTNSPTLKFKIIGGTNLNTTGTVYMHNLDLLAPTQYLGVDMATSAMSEYGHNFSSLYIIDQNSDDRLMVTSKVGLDFIV